MSADKDRANDFCRMVLSSNECPEARAWLGAGNRSIGTRTSTQSVEAVEALYEAGASTVRVVISARIPSDTPDLVIVELPQEQAARAAIFAKPEVTRPHGGSGPLDVGQSCAVMFFGKTPAR